MCDDVIKWKHFPRYWSFVRGIHRSPVNSPHKGQWRGALMFSLIYTWTHGWVNNREAGDLRRYRAHYDVIAMDELTLKVSRAYTTSRRPFGITIPGATRIITFLILWRSFFTRDEVYRDKIGNNLIKLPLLMSNCYHLATIILYPPRKKFFLYNSATCMWR